MNTTTKPSIIEINELSSIAFARAAVLIQQGYQFSPMRVPETYGFTGQASITLVLAEPAADAVAGAADSLALALDLQTAHEERSAAAALAATEAEQTRKAAKQAIELELVAAKNLVRRLDAAQKRA